MIRRVRASDLRRHVAYRRSSRDLGWNDPVKVLITIIKVCIRRGIMIMCLCKGVSEREIVEAIRRGARSIDDVGRRCEGAGGDCGACRGEITAVLRECRSQAAA